MSGIFSRIAAAAATRRGAVLTAALLLTLIGVVAAARLDTDASTGTLVDRGSDTYAASEEFKEKFGDDAIPILVRSDAKHDLRDLMLTEDLGQILAFEDCLAGNVRQGRGSPPQVCTKLAATDAVRVVYGPGTFLEQAVEQAKTQLDERSQATVATAREAAAAAYEGALEQGFSKEEAEAAGLTTGQQVIGEFQQGLLQLAIRYGQTGIPRIDDPQFVSNVVFDTRLGGGEPKQKFALLWPSPNAAQVTVRLEPDLSAQERSEAIELINDAASDPALQPKNGEYFVSGVPIVVEELASEFRGEIFVLLAGALAVMALALTLIFGPPMRLLPLAVALMATAITFGVLSLTGGSLTLASIAVLPVLIGLSIDYAIQFQARYREAVAAGDPPLNAVRQAASRGGPVIATAALATSAGFAVLLLSPIPIVRSFGILLVLGIALSLGIAMTVGSAVLVAASARGRSEPGRFRVSAQRAGARLRGTPVVAGIGKGANSVGAWLRRFATAALALSIRSPGPVLAVAFVLAAGGWFAGTKTEVVSDLRELVPESVLERANVDVAEEETGVSGEFNVLVSGKNVSDPEVVAWMADLKQRILTKGGFGGEFPSCEAAQVCPQIAVSDLVGAGTAPLTKQSIKAVLDAIPPYFAQAVIARDPESGELENTANVGFGITLQPLDDQKTLFDAIRAEIDPPGSENDAPPGVEAELAGLPVLAADASSDLSDGRYVLTIAGLLAVALVLLVVYRSVGRALVPLVPIVLATGWSALVLWALQIPLNPMSATLGALVIAIATEFSVILSSRYREERSGGLSVGEALRRTYARTGTAVLASGVTAIAGFAVLALAAPVELVLGEDAIPMLTEFGLVTVIDLAVALAGVMLVLPAALVLAERLPRLRTVKASADGERRQPA